MSAREWVIRLCLPVLLMPLAAAGRESAIDSLAVYHAVAAANSGKIQQEMIYLHLDNTSYYRGDRVYFAGYLVTASRLTPSNLSQTVYVELLNPGGKIIDQCVLKPHMGRFHGSLLVDETPFYSGYYEIRAYTRYMLNFGDEAIFSRVIPVFAEPKREGNRTERRMLAYGSARRKFRRPKPLPLAPNRKVPEVVKIDVSSRCDNVGIGVSTSSYSFLGASLTCRGELYYRAILDLSASNNAELQFAREMLPSGVCRLTLFDTGGNCVAQSQFFNFKGDDISIYYEFDKAEYQPYEPVELTLKLSEPARFSLSVTDADERVEPASDILSEFLLAGELNGYIPNLCFAEADSLLGEYGRERYSWSQLAGIEPPTAILEMPEQGIELHGRVQSLRGNKSKAGVTVTAMLSPMSQQNDKQPIIDEFQTDSLGRFSFISTLNGDWLLTLSTTEKNKRQRHRILFDDREPPRARPYYQTELQYRMAETPVNSMPDKEPDSIEAARGTRLLKEVEVTALAGHAADLKRYVEASVVSYDIDEEYGRLQDKGEKYIRRLRDILPLIDSNFMQNGSDMEYASKQPLYIIDDALADNATILQYSDIDSSNPADLSVKMVKKVYINTQAQAIGEYAIWYFESGLDLNEDFVPPELEFWAQNDPTSKLARENRDFHASFYQALATRLFGCVIFVELSKNDKSVSRPGLRRSKLRGYSEPASFQHPDYAVEPPADPDFRRTLYWNPEVVPDENGTVRIRFYNNGTAKRFNVSAAILGENGEIGTLR